MSIVESRFSKPVSGQSYFHRIFTFNRRAIFITVLLITPHNTIFALIN